MNPASQEKKDLYGGAVMILLGSGGAAAGLTHRVGGLVHMGPGFFPVAIGLLLALSGVFIALMAVLRMRRLPAAGLVTPGRGDPAAESLPPQTIALAPPSAGIPDLRGSVCIVAGVLAFLGVARYLGLFPATFAIVFISALGDRKNTLVQALVLAAALAVVAAVLFSWALRLQLPLFKWGG